MLVRAPSSAPLATTRLRQSTHRASSTVAVATHLDRKHRPLRPHGIAARVGQGCRAWYGVWGWGKVRQGTAAQLYRTSVEPVVLAQHERWPFACSRDARIAADRGAARSEPRSNQFCVSLLWQHHGLSDGLSVTWPFHARSTECTLRVLVRTAAHGRFHVVPVCAPAAELLRPRGRVRPRSELVQQHPVGVAATETETRQSKLNHDCCTSTLTASFRAQSTIVDRNPSRDRT